MTLNPQTWNPGRRTLTIFAALLMASLPLAGLGGADPLSVSVDTNDLQGCDPARDLVVGCKVWSASNATDAGNTADWPDVDISPDGETAYIAHYVTNASFRTNFRMEAVDVATGDLQWGHMSPGLLADAVLSHDGQRLYALGDGPGTGDSMVVRAIDAETGALAWQDGHGAGTFLCNTFRACVVTSLDDAAVFAAAGDLVALESSTGALLWNRTMTLDAIAVAPATDSMGAPPARDAACDNPGAAAPFCDEAPTALYVVGSVPGPDHEFRSDLLVARFDPTDGTTVWSQTFGDTSDGEPCHERATSVLVSPDGGTVYATGTSCAGLSLSLDAADGTINWVQTAGQARFDVPTDASLSPDGGSLFVAGNDGPQEAVWAFDAATGDPLWSDTFATNWGSSPYVTASTDGQRVLVAATQDAVRAEGTPLFARPDFVTRAYDATNGTILWEAQEHKASWDWVGGVAVTPDGELGLVTGMVWGDNLDPDVAETIAYRMVPPTVAEAECEAEADAEPVVGCQVAVETAPVPLGL